MMIYKFIYLTIITFCLLMLSKYLWAWFYNQKVSYSSFRYKIIVKYSCFIILFNNYKVLNKIVSRWFVSKQFLFNNHLEWSILKKLIDSDRERSFTNLDKTFKDTFTPEDKEKLKNMLNRMYENPMWKRKFDKLYFKFLRKNPQIPVKL